MANYVGGSAPAMVRQISEGFTLVTAMSLKRLDGPELDVLQFEIDKKLREIRGEQIDLEDLPGIQVRNRRLSRLEGALRVVRATAQARRRGRA